MNCQLYTTFDQAMAQSRLIKNRNRNQNAGSGNSGSRSHAGADGVGLILFIIGIIWFIKNYWTYAICVAIAGICLFIIIKISRRAIKPGLKVLITGLVGIVLIVIVLAAAPSANAKKPQPNRNQNTSAQVRYMLVNSDALNVRKGPSADHDVAGQLKRGDRVQVLNSSGQWWRIKSGNIEGYVNSAYLINEDKAPPAPVSQLPVRPTATEPGMGTTRSAQYQREWEEAYDRAPPTLPSGLVLPSGETVEERVQSGRVYGK
jgi:uncharacterized protein YraI